MKKLEATITFCGLFEAELLASLMLRHWEHPRSSDRDLTNALLETAAEILARSQAGDRFFEGIRPEDMNFVAALWYAESCQVADVDEPDTGRRREWLVRIRRSLPSCFCDPDELHLS